jgi:hypothetical protein
VYFCYAPILHTGTLRILRKYLYSES